MKTKKAGKVILFVSFLAVICFGWILWFPLSRFVDTSNHENRGLHEMPRITSVEDYREFPKKFEWFLDDHSPFRNQLITLNNGIDYFVFGEGNDRVAAGKDGWLFYCDSADGNPIACYQGGNLLMDVHLRQIAENCVRQRDYLAERGIEFVIFVAPNKERMYPEYMPDRYGAPAEEYKALQVVNYLRENTDLRVVYPYEELMAAKAALPEEIYYKTDTHWNYIGGYIGARALLRELGIGMPPPEELTVTPAGEKEGDLSHSLGLEKFLKSAEYTVEGYDAHGAESLGEFDDVYAYRAEGADPRKFYAIRDSFFVSMVPYIHSQFSESHSKYYLSYLYKDFAEQKPDIFVYECVERYIDGLSTFSVEYGK